MFSYTVWYICIIAVSVAKIHCGIGLEEFYERKGLDLICHSVCEVVILDNIEKYHFYMYLFGD